MKFLLLIQLNESNEIFITNAQTHPPENLPLSVRKKSDFINILFKY